MALSICSGLLQRYSLFESLSNLQRVVPAVSRLVVKGTQRRFKVIPKAPEPPRRVNLQDLRKWKVEGRKIVMITAYDYPSAVHADLAEIDVVLVGDSVAMVALGHDTTQKVTLTDMIHHCRAVVNGCKRPLIVGDLPFGSYEVSPEQAMSSAYRLIKEGSVDAVKLEGGKKIAETVHRIVQGGIAVMGHVGLTPASVSAIGGFRSFGRNCKEAKDILEDAFALQEAGAFAVVLECVPQVVAKHITELLHIPTIGIGAGKYTSGQVLVYHDMCGMLQHPHHAKVTPKFCKKYAQVGEAIQEALENYRDEVRNGEFPSETYSPYHMPKEEYEQFLQEIQTSPYLKPQQVMSHLDVHLYGK
ncbi:hypothetical protein GpartN1_g2896.t1 [Galdieria partita]|uniref:3-methyl-2-oxobutanoate hydroxymethyltransferase n=1 Tax=Galdieria partita TaxID=83374 RepID=A0A9C7PV73_9RHOD|nr:hypothetical protein GpartN1_g2896.t1 [Galdieria partita]